MAREGYSGCINKLISSLNTIFDPSYPFLMLPVWYCLYCIDSQLIQAQYQNCYWKKYWNWVRKSSTSAAKAVKTIYKYESWTKFPLSSPRHALNVSSFWPPAPRPEPAPASAETAWPGSRVRGAATRSRGAGTRGTRPRGARPPRAWSMRSSSAWRACPCTPCRCSAAAPPPPRYDGPRRAPRDQTLNVTSLRAINFVKLQL